MIPFTFAEIEKDLQDNCKSFFLYENVYIKGVY